MVGDFPAWGEIRIFCSPVTTIYTCVSVTGIIRVSGAGRVGATRIRPGRSGLGGAHCLGKDQVACPFTTRRLVSTFSIGRSGLPRMTCSKIYLKVTIRSEVPPNSLDPIDISLRNRLVVNFRQTFC
eukprot:6570666-Pyramimonas_sp.AAC.1